MHLMQTILMLLVEFHFLQVYNNTFNNHWSNITENTVQISAGNYTFENNTFINCNQTIRGVNNTFINCTQKILIY